VRIRGGNPGRGKGGGEFRVKKSCKRGGGRSSKKRKGHCTTVEGLSERERRERGPMGKRPSHRSLTPKKAAIASKVSVQKEAARVTAEGKWGGPL